MSGKKFAMTQSIPWVVWLYALRKDFLLDNQLFFAEYVRFEDEDYSIKCMIKAKRVKYIPLVVVCYSVNNDGQTSKVNKDDVAKISDMFKGIERTKQIAIEAMAQDKALGNLILGHHFFMYKSVIMRYLWHLPPKVILHFLKNYQPYKPCNDFLLTFCLLHPKCFAYGIILGKPFFPLLRKIYLLRKK